MEISTILFWLIFVATGLCAIAVVVTQNIVRAAAWLLFTLAGTAGVFFLLGADFVAATQLIVYVGGTLVLVVFGVMLTAQGPFITMKTGAVEWAIATVVGLTLLGVIVICTSSLTFGGALPKAKDPAAPHSITLGGALVGVPDATKDAELTGVPNQKIPRTKMGFLLPFEIVSVHLLVVLIGAAYLARAKRRRGSS